MKYILKCSLCFILLSCVAMLSSGAVLAEEKKSTENPSNPLAAASNLDLRVKYIDLGNGFDR